MGRSLFLLLISNLIGVVLSSGVLMATDHVAVDIVGLDGLQTMEKGVVVDPNETKGTTPSSTVNSGDEIGADMADAVTIVNSAPNYVAPVGYTNSISIAGQTLEIIDVASEELDAGYHVNRMGGKFLYGHNSGAVFGGLASMGEGSTFSINNGGVVTNYQVMLVEHFEKNDGKLQKNGKGNFINAVIGATYMGQPYDLSIMTCEGQVYKDGDASHRLVLFANAV